MATENKTEIATTPAPTAKKYLSRKFIMALVGVITGIAGIFCANDNVVAVISFAALEILSIVGYILVEGKIDAASINGIGMTVEQLAKMIAALTDNDPNTNPVIPENKPADDLLDKIDTSSTTTTTEFKQ